MITSTGILKTWIIRLGIINDVSSRIRICSASYLEFDKLNGAKSDVTSDAPVNGHLHFLTFRDVDGAIGVPDARRRPRSRRSTHIVKSKLHATRLCENGLLSFFVCFFLSVCLSVCLSFFLYFFLSVYLSVCLSVCLSHSRSLAFE